MTNLHYIPCEQGQTILFPQRIDEDIAENDPVLILNHIVEHLDLKNVHGLYRERGRSPYDPKNDAQDCSVCLYEQHILLP